MSPVGQTMAYVFFKGLFKTWPVVLILIGFLVVKRLFSKGWAGEKATAFVIWNKLDNSVYHPIHNVIIPASNGTTQIDHVLVSKYGIFVIETKDMKGWIYGEPDSEKWTQNIYGRKTQFRNPIRQNYRHTKCLSEYLNINHDLIKPVVYFVGECELKSPMPDNVLTDGVTSYIQKFDNVHFTDEQVHDITENLIKLKNDATLNNKTHLASLRERYESTTICPKCGGKLKERRAKKGSHAGETFLGCSNYPRCGYTKQIM
jgi:restriction system protein